ncbi:MAG: hypothetical protein AB1515_10150 [Nitrospirota bacterium]
MLGSLFLMIAIAGCATGPMAIPAEEIRGLLEHQTLAGLHREQAMSLRALLERSEASQQGLERHLSGESRELEQHYQSGASINSTALWGQVSLVHQLRAERLLGAALLREEARSELTEAQREWFHRYRLRLIFPSNLNERWCWRLDFC